LGYLLIYFPRNDQIQSKIFQINEYNIRDQVSPKRDTQKIKENPLQVIRQQVLMCLLKKMTRPFLKASATSGSLFILGDIINQSLHKNHHQHNWSQTIQFGAIGFLLHGPYFRYGFTLLEKYFPGKSIKPVLLKSIAGQLLVFPPYVLLYLSITSYLNQLDPIETIKVQFPKIFVNAVLVWPIANMITFRFVPIQHRLLFVNLVGVGWNSYLSFETYNRRI
jgi:protein Mpv17